jgi:UDP-N-acetylmuramoyl-tripeptide--D-alanyl-D-alanine ligase
VSAKYTVFRNRGNLNNHIGLPLSLLELRSRPDVAVVELGMNHAGEIRTLVGIAEPDVRVWTNVGDAHAGFFASVDAIADAKAEILEQARPGDLLVANADDPRIRARAGRFAGRLLTFGVSDGADYAPVACAPRPRRHGRGPGHAARERRRRDAALGTGNLLNLLAAAAVAAELGVPLDASPRAATMRRRPSGERAAAPPAASRDRRLVQLEPRRAQNALRPWRSPPAAREDRRARRDARARRHATRRHRMRPPPREAGLDL